MHPATLLDQPRAIGTAMLTSKQRGAVSCIDDLRQSGALKLLFPRSPRPLEAVVINTAGGITGGDRFDISAGAGPGSQLTLTTQAAERAYRAQPGQVGRLTTRLRAQVGATLRWLPQETILYDGSALHRRLEVDLDSTAEFLMVEPVIFGRQAMGETLRQTRFRDRVRIRQDGGLIYADGVDLDGDAATMLARPAVAGGARAMASLMFAASRAEAHLDRIRALVGPTGGASLLGKNVLVARMLAEGGYELRARLVPILQTLTDHQLPANWRL